MIDKNMLKLAEIRNSFSLKKWLFKFRRRGIA